MTPPPVEQQSGSASPTLSWGWARSARGQKDTTETPEPETKQVLPRVPWKGTAVAWTNSLTTSAAGIGGDTISHAHEVYTQGYGITLNYYFTYTPNFKWRASTSPGFDIELTNSNQTTDEHEIVVRDLPITTVAIASLYNPEDSLYSMSLFGNFTAIVPTSKYTRGAGDLLTLSPRTSLFQVIPLLGKSSPFFKAVLLGVGVRYDALFSRSTVAVSNRVSDIPRRVTENNSIGASTDVLNGTRLAPHTGRASGFMMFQERVADVPINLVFGMNYTSARLYHLNDQTRELPTGEIVIQSVGRNTRPSAGVGAALTVFPLADFAISLGYSNNADLGGPTPNMWYSPGAQFTAALAVGIDAIYERLTGPARTVPFILF